MLLSAAVVADVEFQLILVVFGSFHMFVGLVGLFEDKVVSIEIQLILNLTVAATFPY